VTIVVTASPSPLISVPWVDEPDVSVVVVTYGSGLILESCLAAVSVVAADLSAELIVVDNLHPELGSWVGDRLCLGTEGVRLVRTGDNLGFGGGNAAGIAAARSDTICLLNPDALLEPGQLDRLIEALGDRTDLIVAPGFVNLDGSIQELGQRLVSSGEPRSIREPGSHAPDYASAACWVLRRELFELLDGFDPIYHPAYYEDVDFVLRAKALGCELEVVADVLVAHEQRAALDAHHDDSRQRAVFVDRWAQLLAERPDE